MEPLTNSTSQIPITAVKTPLDKTKYAQSLAQTSSSSMDAVDIRGGSDNPSLSITSLNAASGGSAGSTSSYARAQMVTFSVAYPGGNVIKTTMSMADFQAALQSDDPNALGSEECDGQTWSAKTSIKTAMGLGTTPDATASPSKGTAASTQSNTPSAAVSEASIAVAVLRTEVQDGQTFNQNDGGAKSDPTKGSASATVEAASFKAKSYSGSSDGMTVSISIFSGSIASLSLATAKSGVAAEGVSVIV